MSGRYPRDTSRSPIIPSRADITAPAAASYYDDIYLPVALTPLTCLIPHPLSSTFHLLESSTETYLLMTLNSPGTPPILVMSFRS